MATGTMQQQRRKRGGGAHQRRQAMHAAAGGHRGHAGGDQELAPSSPQTTEAGGGPFVRNARRHSEVAFDSGSIQLGAAQTIIGPKELPALGYQRDVYLDANATGGAAAPNAVAQADAPWSGIANIQFLDIGGQALVDISGYDLFLINAFGGYWFNNNPGSLTGGTAWPNFSAVAVTGNFRFQLYLPVELLWDAYGALENEDAAESYKMRVVVAATSDIYSTNPGTIPAVQLQAFSDMWTRPDKGTQAPPYVGSTCYWKKSIYTGLAQGLNKTKLIEVGNPIHTLILIFRNSSGARVDPSSTMVDFQVRVDGVAYQDSVPLTKWFTELTRDFGIVAPTGVVPVSFRTDFDGHPARSDTAELWLPTNGATRLEIAGTLPAGLANGKLEVLTGYVVPEGPLPYSALT